MFLKLIPLFFKYFSPLFPSFAAQMALDLFCTTQKNERPSNELEFWNTGKALEFSSKRSCRTWGQGPEIWLIHGWSSRGSAFYRIIPLFVKAGFKVIAWEAPAHGDSPGKQTNLVDFSKSLASDIDDHGSKPLAIIGHSFGGAALAIINRYTALPKFVAIISSPSETPKIFQNYKKLINLSKKSFAKLVQKAEKMVGTTIASTSLINNDLSKHSQVLVIHDKKDKEIAYQYF